MSELAERFHSWRNSLISNPRFQRWAAGFPLTAWIARRQSSALFDLCAGFVYSQVLATLVELDVFPILAKRPGTIGELAPTLHLSPPSTERLMRAACALNLCESRGKDRYGLGMLGAALLGNPGVLAMIRHHKLLYTDLAEPLALLRGRQGQTALARFWPYAHGERAADQPVSSAYSALMSASQSLFVEDILEAYAFARHFVVLDVGGGDGTFLSSLARAFPSLSLMLFDLPAVAEQARARFLAEGLSERTQIFDGDMHIGPLPKGADLITLVRVLHDHDDDQVTQILRHVRAALAPGGRVLIVEPMAGIKGNEAMADAYFGFYLLAMGSGRARTPEHISAYLMGAGFSQIRHIKTRRPLLASAISAQAD